MTQRGSRLRKAGRRHNAKGRSERTPRWLQLFYWILDSDAAGELSPNAIYVLLFLWKRYNGRNNGSIGFGVRSGNIKECGRGETILRPLNLSRSRIADALAELERQGFIACAQEGEFFAGARAVREWRLTWLADDRTGQLPTKDFMRPAGQRDTVPPAVRQRRGMKAAALLERKKLKAQSRGQDCDSGTSPAGRTEAVKRASRNRRHSPADETGGNVHSPAGGTHLSNHPPAGPKGEA